MANLASEITRPHGGKTTMKITTIISTSTITGQVNLGFRRLKKLYAQALGNFSGGLSLALEGSLDNTNWFPLLDDAGTPAAIIFTTAGQVVSDRPVRYVRLVRSSGDGSADADFHMDVYSERNN